MPASSLHSQLVVVAIAGVVGIFVCATLAPPWIPSPFYQASVASAVFVTVAAMAWLWIDGHHPWSRLGPANQLTLLRALIVAMAGSLIVQPNTIGGAWSVVVAGTVVAGLDGVDGWWARRSGMASVFGARLDMETDAFFILVLSMLVWKYDKAGAWVLGCGLVRYAFVAAGWLLPWLAGPLSPTWRGKTVAVMQFVGLLVAIAPIVPPPASGLVAALTLAALVVSFAIDVSRLWRQRPTLAWANDGGAPKA